MVGLDLGGSVSMTAAAVCWPATGRLEVFAGLPVPHDLDLEQRGRADGVGRRYQQLADQGELWTYPGARTTPVVAFMRDLSAAIHGQRVTLCGLDRYRRAEVGDYLAESGLHWPLVFRGQGLTTVAESAADVRAFQRAVIDGWIHPARGGRLMVHAIAESAVKYSTGNHPTLQQGRHRGRIDPLAAAVIAVGLAERERMRAPRRSYRERSFMVGAA